MSGWQIANPYWDLVVPGEPPQPVFAEMRAAMRVLPMDGSVMLAGRAGELSTADFPFLLTAGAPAPALDRDLDQIERARIIKVLEENNWSKSAAAR